MNTFYNLKLQGNLNSNSHYIQNLPDPVNAQDAATKNWVTNNFFSSSGTNFIRNDENQTYSYLLTFSEYSPWVIQNFRDVQGWRRFPGTINDSLMVTPKGYVDSLVNACCSAIHLWNNNVFNSLQFSFSGTKINLLYPYSPDSNSMRKLNIYKDTTIGESQIQKNWVLKRPFYNYEDSMTLKWYYYNSAVSSNPLDSFYLLNKAYNVRDNDEDISLTTTNSSIKLFSLPNNSAATWKVTITFEYLFDFGINNGSSCNDSITISWAGKYTTVKYGYPAAVYAGMQGSASLIVLISTKGSLPDGNIYGICSQNAVSSITAIARKIKHLRVIAEIVN